MQITEVVTRHDRKEFHDFPKRLYKNDPFWVCPLDSEIEGLFDPAKNHTFKQGVATRWILKDNGGKTIGRVAAFIDNVRSAAQKQPTGGMGFFEVIEEREAAFLLFDTAKAWLASRGMEAMDGPVNFGENDNFWGLLIAGFMQQGYGMPYSMKYYRDFFESYGFKNYFEQYSYHREARNEKGEITRFPERVWKVAEWVAKKPGYTFRHFEFKNARKYINDICEIYNSTWSYLKDDFTPLIPDILEESIRKARQVIDEETVIFIYQNDKPVGFWVLLPDLNQILKYLNGKLDLISIIKFLYYKKTHKITRLRAVVGGVMHSHQNQGIEAAIFYHLYEVFKHKPWYKEVELSWVGDYNVRMMASNEALGGIRMKTHCTYRYLINDKLSFMRYKDEMAEKQKNKEEKKAGVE
ncbi:MAG: GNAT family N-acetyltransferase [Bacteroidia bacterium]|nr:GNAT family N-acetyltransferase [Bacteroidia bacterium]